MGNVCQTGTCRETVDTVKPKRILFYPLRNGGPSVPRPNPPRSLQSEESLARRIAYERDRRGWTNEGTAKRLTDVGCPIQGSAIYKIEKGTPRRRISVDELVAFAAVFEVSAADLLIPLELIAEHEALGLIAEVERKYHALSESVADYRGTVERIQQLAGTDEAYAQDVVRILWEKVASLSIFDNIDTSKKDKNELFNSLLSIKVPPYSTDNKRLAR
jgi:transcriptional regulator with XRE-family HTH domain